MPVAPCPVRAVDGPVQPVDYRGAVSAVAPYVDRIAGARRTLEATQRSLEARQVERDAWRRSAEDALAGLGVAIDRQFAAWGLTPTEGEVALLLLKGYGHKQIAGDTGRSERTVRQHAVAVYQKAGLGGRAELAAFFLQDLMLPGERGKGP
ncbi:MAG: helix-turn-helix transcriptional regulator [Gemmatimonadetes bacterium]|nr:helix-turn-helix transcriptional regulator [Gemmatimonadota bacterium]